MMKIQYITFWMRKAFICLLVVFTSMWCMLAFVKWEGMNSQQAKLNVESETKLYPLSRQYNGSVISSLYKRGFDINPQICGPKKHGVRLLVLVHSSYNEQERRQSVRHTWKAVARMNDVAVAFLLGRSTDNKDMSVIQEESSLYGDVIVSRNLDSFDRLTLKSIAMAEWVSEYCPEARFVVKADSDVFLNVHRLLEVMKDLSDSKRTVFGHLLRDTAPLREDNYKHRVTELEYPADKYPDYMQGGTYMFTADLASRQFSAALDMNFFRMEDVFFTGFLVERLGARLMHVDGFFCMLSVLEKTKVKGTIVEDFDVCDLRKRVAVHHGQFDTMFHLWQLAHYKSVKCTCACS